MLKHVVKSRDGCSGELRDVGVGHAAAPAACLLAQQGLRVSPFRNSIYDVHQPHITLAYMNMDPRLDGFKITVILVSPHVGYLVTLSSACLVLPQGILRA